MKKMTGLALAGTAVFILSGCGGGTDVVYVDEGPELVTLFLVDEHGYGIEYVPYTCYAPDGSIVTDFETDFYGEFSFVPGDRCEFDLYGFAETLAPHYQPIFITDGLGYGKGDIPYSCINYDLDIATDGVTEIDGYFDYPIDAFVSFIYR